MSQRYDDLVLMEPHRIILHSNIHKIITVSKQFFSIS